MNGHPNPYHWSRAARQFTDRMAVYAMGRRLQAAPAADTRVISVDDIYTYADSLGIPLLITDDEYCLMTENSFKEQLAAQFSNMSRILKPNINGIPEYQPGAWDCEDFAFLMRDLMRVAHQRTPDNPQAGLAVGVYCYQPDGAQSLHAIVCALVRDAGQFRFIWAEPQGGQMVKLSQAEQLSCMGVWL